MPSVKQALPFSFKEFVKEPVKAMLLLVTLAIGYMYVENKLSYTNQIERQGKKIEVLETKVDILTVQLRKSDSTLAAATATFTILEKLGKIK